MDLNSKKIAAKNPIIYFSEGNGFGKHSRLKGNSIITDNNFTEIKKEFLQLVNLMMIVHLGQCSQKNNS